MADVSKLRANINGVFETFGVKDKIARENAETLNKALSAAQIVNSASGAIASFSDGADGLPVRSLTVDLEPIQDLHGYDSPWPAGGGKNKLPLDADTIKTMKGGSSIWSGNTYTTNGITFTLHVDEAGVIQKITANGTATANALLYIISDVSVAIGSSVIVTRPGVSTGGFKYDGKWIDLAAASTAVENVSIVQSLWIRINSGVTVNNVDCSPMIRLATETDATFAPYSNICPITGRDSVTVTRTGINVWDEEWKVVGDHIASKNPIPCMPGTAYYMSAPEQPSNGLKFYTKSMAQTGSTRYNAGLFTTPSDCYYMTFEMTNRYGTTYNHDISINYPSTDHDYHAYDGQSVTVQLGQTVYGGTVDVVSGKLTVDFAIKAFNGTENYSNAYFPTIVCTGGGGDLSPIGDYNRRFEVVCSHASDVSFASANATNIQWRYVNTVFGVSNAAEFKAYVAQQYANGTPVTVAYPIATPLEITLDPATLSTLKGTNNLWSDADSVTVDYVADPKLYIDSLTEPDSDMVADTNIISGKYFTVNNVLYLATANIANGAAIIPGTNCTKTNLAEALNALKA